MKGNKLKLFGIIAAAAVIGLTAVGCDNGSSPGSGGGMGSSQVTVTFYRNFRAGQGSGVSPQPITVTAGTEIELPDGSGMQRWGTMFAGWSTQANGGVTHEAGDNFRVQGDVILYARWIQLEQIPITISSEFPQHTQVNVILTTTAGGHIGSTTVWPGVDGQLMINMNAFPGNHNIRLEVFAFGELRRFNSDGPLAITRPDPETGEHANEFSIDDDFVEMLPVYITIDGVPGNHWNPARIELRQDGNMVESALGWSNGTTSVTFNQVFSTVAADNYEILFRWSNDNNSVFRMASVEIGAGQNNIAFDDFDEIQSVYVTITVTGVPSSFVGDRGMMTLIHNDSKFRLLNVPTETMMLESTTTFTFVFPVFPGTHYIRLTVRDEDHWGDVREIRERTVNIAATATGTNNVTWASFSTVPFTRITINGIDTRFNGNYAVVFVGNLEAMNTNNMQNVIADGWGVVSNRSLTAVLESNSWPFDPITDEDVYGNVIVYFFNDDYDPVGEYATNAIVEFPAGRITTVQWNAFNIDLSGRPIQLHQALLGQIRERARSMRER